MRGLTPPVFDPRFLTALALVGLCQASVRAQVDYNRDVLPILASKCYACHGVDEKQRKAKLRLDVKEVAFAERDGVRAIVPGKPGESALVSRIFSAEKGEVMPPPGKGRTLSDAEKTILREWVAEGAVYREHWAFSKPSRPEVPKAADWAANEVDRFILAGLEAAGFAVLTPGGDEERGGIVTIAVEDAVDFNAALEAQGILAGQYLPGQIRLDVALFHDDADIQRTLRACKEAAARSGTS